MSDSDDRFNESMKTVFEHEGLFSDNPADPGGATNYGISLRFLKSYGIDINDDGQINLQDIKALDKPKASAIYKQYWWDRYRYGQIEWLPLATKILDMSVNMGAGQAHKLLQRALSAMGYPLVDDGLLGAKSWNAIKSAIASKMCAALLSELKEQQRWFYIDLVCDKPTLAVFLKGWLRRANG